MATFDEIHARLEEQKRAQFAQELALEAVSAARVEVDRLNSEANALYSEADQKRNEAQAKQSEAGSLSQEIENRQPAVQASEEQPQG